MKIPYVVILFFFFSAFVPGSLSSASAEEDHLPLLEPSGRLHVPCLEIEGSFYRVEMALENGRFTVLEAASVPAGQDWCAMYESGLMELFIPMLRYGDDRYWTVLDVTSGDVVTASVRNSGKTFQDILAAMSSEDRECYDLFNILMDADKPVQEYENAVKKAGGYPENSYCKAAMSVAHAFVRGVPEDVPRPECASATGIYAQLNGCVGIHNNPETAFRLATESAGTGNITGNYAKAMLYDLGIGTPQSWKDALEYYLIAASGGFAPAENRAGIFYEKAQLVKKDYPEAFRWYMLAALQGSMAGEYNVGWMYDNGYGVKQDYAAACRWYMLSARQGLADAQNRTGMCYENGYGVEQDYIAAYEWYMKAADQDNAFAQYNIGRVYEYGMGKWQSLPAACTWYRQALSNGYAGAQAAVNRVCH